MTDSQSQTDKHPEKAYSALESVPEEISFNIVQVIRSWAEMTNGGSLEEKEIRRRSRDSTLRAVALTSSRNLLTFQQHLLRSVTTSRLNILSLLSFLCMDSNRGQFIRSLQLGLEEGSQNALDLSDTLTSEILAYSSLPTTAEITLMSDDKTKYAIMASAFQNLSLGLLVQLQHLEELIVLDQAFYFPLRIYLTTDSGTQVLFPLPFLTNSIKKLYILLASDNYVAFSARNSVWLMVFCKSLNEISIGFDISANDVAFLAEYKEIFKHKSNVKKLAIQFRFKAAQKAQSGLSKIQKEQSLSDLLLVTNGLEAFEFNGNWAHELDETLETQPNYEGAFSSLSSSESSLRHLRRFGTLGTRRSVISTSPFILKSFKNLRMLSTDLYGLFYLRHRAISLDVEILQMVYYYVDLTHSSPDTEAYADFRGIEYLVEAQLLPNLKTLMIPKQPINMTSEIDKSPSRKAIWAEKRSRFLSKDYFKNGRIKVIEFEAGELFPDISEGSDFLSTARWISS